MQPRNINPSDTESSLAQVGVVKLSDALQVEPWFTTELQLRALLGGHLKIETECSSVILVMPPLILTLN